MHLKNRFKEEDKNIVWIDHPYCALCLSNQDCSLHHIDSTISDSILGSIMLCGVCHRIADGNNVSENSLKLEMTHYTLRHIFTKTNYILKDRDYKYLDRISDRINKIHLSNNS